MTKNRRVLHGRGNVCIAGYSYFWELANVIWGGVIGSSRSKWHLWERSYDTLPQRLYIMKIVVRFQQAPQKPISTTLTRTVSSYSLCYRWHTGTAPGSWVQSWAQVTFCAEFCKFSLFSHEFLPGSPVFTHCPETQVGGFAMIDCLQV